MNHDALIDALSGYVTTDANGTVVYCNSKGEPHRLDGPAIIFADGEEHWYQNGLRHRVDGPAVVYPNSQKFWFIED